MKNNLESKKIRTTTENIVGIKNIEDIKKYLQNEHFVIAYLDNEVLIGTYNNGDFNFYQKKKISIEFIQKMRIFNENEELFIWRSNGKLIGRKRIDEKGIETEVIDVNQVLFGTKSEKLNENYVKLTEDRGVEVIMPDNSYVVDKKQNRIAVQTRNYIGYTENWQAGYTDVRFVKFVQLPKEDK